jgi:outer membrane biosynthesis protein TonB
MKRTSRALAAALGVAALLAAAPAASAQEQEQGRVAVVEPATPAAPTTDALTDQTQPVVVAAPVTKPEPAPLPAEPAPAPEPQPAPATEPVPEPGPAPAPETQPQPTPGDATAVNESLTVQVVWQVQRGCHIHCYRTRQVQSSNQDARTTQNADASAPAGDATASNRSRTIQFVWQTQLGCVAFCYETSQEQSASQSAATDQSATASGADASASNDSLTRQFAFQFQRGCVYECYATSQYQSAAQSSEASQDATADAYGDDEQGLAELRAAFAEVEAWAAQVSATIQFSIQYQDSDCRAYCRDEIQEQLAAQQAVTTQNARALE